MTRDQTDWCSNWHVSTEIGAFWNVANSITESSVQSEMRRCRANREIFEKTLTRYLGTVFSAETIETRYRDASIPCTRTAFPKCSWSGYISAFSFFKHMLDYVLLLFTNTYGKWAGISFWRKNCDRTANKFAILAGRYRCIRGSVHLRRHGIEASRYRASGNLSGRTVTRRLRPV